MIFPLSPPKKETFAGGKSNWLKNVTFLLVFLKIIENILAFPNFCWIFDKKASKRLLLAANWDDCNFSRLLLVINRDNCSFLRLLVAINRYKCIFLRFLLAINRDNYSYFFRIPYSGLQLRAYGTILSKTNENDY